MYTHKTNITRTPQRRYCQINKIVGSRLLTESSTVEPRYNEVGCNKILL